MFVIVTQVISSQNKVGEIRTDSPVSISSAVNVERTDCPNPPRLLSLCPQLRV